MGQYLPYKGMGDEHVAFPATLIATVMLMRVPRSCDFINDFSVVETVMGKMRMWVLGFLAWAGHWLRLGYRQALRDRIHHEYP